MSLSEIINVQISRDTQAVTKAGFGVLLFLDSTTVFAERVRQYEDVASMIADGFLASSPAVKAATAYFSQSPSPTKIKIGRTDGVETLTAAIYAIIEEDNDWYGFACYNHTEAAILEIAGVIETLTKIYGTSSSDVGIKAVTTTDVAGQLAALNYTRTFLIYHADADTNFAEVAWFGKQLPTDAGSTTWKFKNLAGITASNLTTTESSNVRSKDANVYLTIGGIDITCDGTMAAGEFIDIIRGVDWLESRMTERIFRVMATSPKIPYTDGGIAIIETEVRAQLDQAIDQGVINGEIPYTVTVPKVVDVDINDKALRTLPAIKFDATLAGAIHSASVQGVVTV